MDPGSRLEAYRRKRSTDRTPEPAGTGDGERSSGSPMFVVQEHAARTRHFDFRLEIDGVLVSWAVPEGPTTDPRERRLAVRTEDHPLDYAGFEGVIPEGEYGAGAVIVWERGPYRNLRAEKEGDEEADARRRPTSTEPESVLSGRTVSELAEGEPAE